MHLDPGRFDSIDHRLHDHLVEVVLDRGAQHLKWLVHQARRDLRDARIDLEAAIRAIEVSTVLVSRPDGRIDHALALLEGNVLTHRVRAPLHGRPDLCLGLGVQPLLNIAAFGPIALADGSGEVRRSEPGYDALVGPPGWLPDIDRYELVGLRITDQKLAVEPVNEEDLPSPEEQLRVRQMLSSIYTTEQFLNPDHDFEVRPAELARTISIALLEDPGLFRSPFPPLDELLHNPLQRDVDLDHWRDVAVGQQQETVGFWIDGLPASLHIELIARARHYGMSDRQFIVAMLSTLAWRTPFAEDLEPMPQWWPESERST